MKFIFVFLVLLMTGCATKVTSITEDRDKELANNKGYLLIGIQTSQNLKAINISGPTFIQFTSKDIKHGTNYLLVDLEAGTYTVDKVKLDRNWRIDLEDEEYWNFTVSPGKINYVGHIEVANLGNWFANYKVELVNRSSESLEFLEKKYPNILANRKIRYGGPGEDSFFTYLEGVKL